MFLSVVRFPGKRLLLVCFVAATVGTGFIDYGRITLWVSEPKSYQTTQEWLDSIGIQNDTEKRKAELIFSLVAELEHGLSRYSFFENPVSEIFERYIFSPAYKHFWGRSSAFLNTVREPHLLANLNAGICHQTSIAIVKLSEMVGLPARVVWLDGHVVSEIFYDNGWHLFDADQDIFFRDNGSVLSVDELIRKMSDREWVEIQGKVASEYLLAYGKFYSSTDNNHIYHLYPYEKYVDIYYLITRTISYFIHLVILCWPIRFALRKYILARTSRIS